LQWNRRFADGTTAPIGSYEVLLQAWDKLGNESWLTARIYIPAAGATPPIPPQTILTTGGETPTAVPTPQGTQPAAAAMVSPTRMPTTEPAPVTMSFSSVPDEPAGIAANKQDGEMTKNSAVDPNILWGAAAVSAAAGAAAYALQKKKEREAARKAAEEAERDAAYAKVAAYEERKKQNYLQKVYAERRRAAEALYAKRMGKVEDVELGPEEAPIIHGLEKTKDVEVYGPSKAEQQRIDKLSRVEEQTAKKDVVERSVSSKTEMKSTAPGKGLLGSALGWLNAQIVQPVYSIAKKNRLLKSDSQESKPNENKELAIPVNNSLLITTNKIVSCITYKNKKGAITKPWWQPAVDWIAKKEILLLEPVYDWANNTLGPFGYDSLAELSYNNNFLNYERWDAIWGNDANRRGLQHVETHETLIKNTAVQSNYVPDIMLAASISIQGDHSGGFIDAFQERNKSENNAFGLGGFSESQIVDMKKKPSTRDSRWT
jgi:hypothetical protein